MDNQGGPLLGATAAVLAGAPPSGDPLESKAKALAEALGYLDSSPSERAAAMALLRSGARLKRVFQLHAPDAPGLVVFGGEADPALLGLDGSDGEVGSLAGSGLTLRAALEGCLGEGVEYLSQVEWGDEALVKGPTAAIGHGLGPEDRQMLLARLSIEPRGDGEPVLDWLSARRLGDGASVLVPADLCLRRPAGRRTARPTSPLSLGAAAGRSLEAATLAGLLELVERDAAALWWHGGRRGRSLPLEILARGRADALVTRLRGDASSRRTWLMDITTDLGIPVVVALSDDGRGADFVCGLAARLDPATAARDAVLEMCQMEISYHLVERKRRERGDAALNEADLRHLERRQIHDAGTCPLLHPVGVAELQAAAVPEDAPSMVRFVVERLQHAGLEACFVDLTRPALGVPAVWTCAAGLQPMPGRVTTPRLASEIESNVHSSTMNEVPLF